LKLSLASNKQKTLKDYNNKNWEAEEKAELQTKLRDILHKVHKRMPKEEAHLKPLRLKRIQDRRDAAQRIPTQIYFQVVGQGTEHGSRSLFLYTDTFRFMFNCGEGTQRLCAEYCTKYSVSELSRILVTNKNWDNMGGLTGMYLTIRSAGAPEVTIHGPKGTIDLYHGLKNFAATLDFDIMKHDSSDPPLDTKAFSLHHIDIPAPESKTKVYPETLKYSDWSPTKSRAFLSSVAGGVGSLEHKQNDMSQPYDETVTAYVITIKPKAGELNAAKAISLGVPVGPLMGELKAGRQVVLDDGTVVHSHEVVEPPLPPSTYVVIEIPTMDHMTTLEGEKRLQFDSLKNLKGIFHFTPPDVMRSDRYVAWINSFSADPEIVHVAINDDVGGYESTDVSTMNHKLNMVNPNIFPLLSPDMTVEVDQENEPMRKLVKGQQFVRGKIGTRLHVRPGLGVVESKSVLVDTEEIETKIKEEFPDAQEPMAKVHSELLEAKEVEGSYPKTTFLGTGSAVPSKYRCVSAILVESRPNNFILMDCGEGTVQQLLRKFGVEKGREVLRNLKAVYVSHMHADHHLGFINVARARQRAFQAVDTPPTKLYVMAPSRMAEYLMMYHCRFESFLQDLVQIKNEHLLPFPYKWDTPEEDITQTIYPKVLTEMNLDCGLKSILTCRAVHCPSSFHVAMTFENGEDKGYKIVYTGDTRPHDDLITFGKTWQKTDLLIHEATAEHHMLEDCMAKKHSTFTEAIRNGLKMEAGFTMLTHFSQRYSKLPILDEMEGLEDKVGVASDFMTVCPATYRSVLKSFPAIKAIYPDDYDLMLKRKEEWIAKKAEESGDSSDGGLGKSLVGPASGSLGSYAPKKKKFKGLDFDL